MARANGREESGALLAKSVRSVSVTGEVSGESARPSRLLTNCGLLARTIVCCFNRFIVDLMYFGISLNLGHLGGSLFLTFGLTCSMELAANTALFLVFLRFRYGRKPLYCSSVILAAAGFGLSATSMLFGSSHGYSLALVMVGMFGVSSAATTIYVHTSELFPTSVRSSAMALLDIAGMCGGVVSPYVFQMSDSIEGRLGHACPMLVYGASALAAGLLILTLPETKDRRMADTIGDAVTLSEQATRSKLNIPDEPARKKFYAAIDGVTEWGNGDMVSSSCSRE
ncbi:hypothetical protein EGW08_023587 [Elysia chlorotica]|uniref:Major facilitator superfamily (MFS) profile domain-containing protein n=1 Tax=Elysia chlorotica TaxID=188477 RepID=A0A433SIE4_ELYCH|nr:hypothetical protein EGW08_023587 [Elysia chlorotica]